MPWRCMRDGGAAARIPNLGMDGGDQFHGPTTSFSGKAVGAWSSFLVPLWPMLRMHGVVHRLLYTCSWRGARLITGTVFPLERLLVDRWWGECNTLRIVVLIGEGSIEVGRGGMRIEMGFRWKWLRIVFRGRIFLPVFICVFPIVAFKPFTVVHIMDGSVVAYTLRRD
jgi:hypothetical protein